MIKGKIHSYRKVFLVGAELGFLVEVGVLVGMDSQMELEILMKIYNSKTAFVDKKGY